jgi:hypothetical protein
MQVGLEIIRLHRDPAVAERLRSGKFRINQELNDEWLDIQNQGPYILNLQGRILACVARSGSRHAPRAWRCLRKTMIRSNAVIPLDPGAVIRIYTGEQPVTPTRINEHSISRVLWLVQPTYLWLPEGHEAHLYFSQQDLSQGKAPLARHVYR